MNKCIWRQIQSAKELVTINDVVKFLPEEEQKNLPIVIQKNGRKFTDIRTGQVGDVFDAVILVAGVSEAEAIQIVLRMAALYRDTFFHQPTPEAETERLIISHLCTGSPKQIAQLSESMNLGSESIRLAAEHSSLRFGSMKDGEWIVPIFVVIDETGMTGTLRRLDGWPLTNSGGDAANSKEVAQ